MLSKKPSLLTGAYGSLHSLQASRSSTSSSLRRRDGTRTCSESTRAYATIAEEPHNPSSHNRHEFPPESPKKEPIHPWPKEQHPTPYQIFAMRSNATYNKSRFNDMVKLYHPDLPTNTACHRSHHDITSHVRMERYRLIVAAHTILSDPVKRSAYDRFGAGWGGNAEARNGQQGTHPGPGPFSSGHGWNTQSDPIWNNATWEDWERFYAWRARQQGGGDATDGQQRGLYMSNSTFIALVAFLAMIGSSVNYKRGQDAGTYFVEQRDLVHDRAAKELRKVRQEMSGLHGRQERIEFFVRQREATMGALSERDIEAMREEKARRVLPEGEVCSSEGVRGSGT